MSSLRVYMILSLVVLMEVQLVRCQFTASDIMYDLMYKASFAGCKKRIRSKNCWVTNERYVDPIIANTTTRKSEMTRCSLTNKQNCEACYHNQWYDIACEQVFRVPELQCSSLPSGVYYTDEGKTDKIISWNKPVYDEANTRLKLKSSGTSGQPFYVGHHYVTYSITNVLGFTTMCSRQFEIKVYTCPTPAWPTNGKVTCQSSVPYWGSTCTYHCDLGYSVVGDSTTTCQQNSQFDNPSPSCDNASPPTIICYPPANSIIAADSKSTKAEITWTPPLAQNKFGNILKDVKQIAGKFSSGDSFPKGLYLTQFEIVDGNGDSANCSFEFEVKVDYCQTLLPPDNGFVTCDRSGFIRGTTCTFQCNQGLKLTGSATATCQDSGLYDNPAPVCEAIICPVISADNGYLSCTNGRSVSSQCNVWCQPGFSSSSFTTTICVDGIWQNGVPQCIDNEKPIFDNCPKEELVFYTLDEFEVTSSGQWPVITARDNSGSVVVTKLSALGNFDDFPLGTTVVTYQAVDGASLSETCSFNVTAKHLECFTPVYTDTSVQIACTGLTKGESCSFTCIPGKELTGASEAFCDETFDFPPKPFWDTLGDPEPECIDIKCGDPPSPSKGSMSCSTHGVFKLCSLDCSGAYDYPRGANTVYACDINSGIWQPNNRIPDCIDKRQASYVTLGAEIYLSSGVCSDTTRPQILSKFITDVQDGGNWNTACRAGKVCTIEDVTVTCMTTILRKRRSANYMHHIEKRATQDASIKWKYRIDFSLDGLTIENARGEHEVYLTDVGLEMDNDVNGGSFTGIFSPFNIAYYVQQSLAEYACGDTEGPGFHNGYCQVCGSGVVYNSATNSCEECTVGSYQPTDQGSTCLPCSSGTTTLDKGSKDVSKCQAPCPLGEFSVSGLGPCYPCTAGTTTNSTGSKVCIRSASSEVQQPTDYCSTAPCGSGNTCYNRLSGYSCYCGSGYRGENCEIPLDGCTNHQCQNGGTCIINPATNTYTCSCGNYFEGEFCAVAKVTSISEWGAWSSWDPCTVTDCGEGVESRTRSCFKDSNQTPCPGNSEDTRHCNFDKCVACKSDDLSLSTGTLITCEGSAVSMTCVPSCQPGYEMTQPSVHNCSNGIWYTGRSVSSCSLLAGWSEWSSWSRCESSCTGSRTRTRLCNNPSPSPSGKPCVGSDTDQSLCLSTAQTVCSECKETDLLPAPGVIKSCTGNTSTFACSITCPGGSVFIDAPPVYQCYYGTWSPGLFMPACTKATSPSVIKRIFTATYFKDCSDQSIVTTTEQQLLAKANNLDCVLSSQCTASVQSSCGSPIIPSRRKRSVPQSTVIDIVLTSQQASGNLGLKDYVSSGQVSGTINTIVQSFKSLDTSSNEITGDASFYEVTIASSQVRPVITSDTGVVECGQSAIDQGGLCVECPPGTYFTNGECSLCGVGTYQNSSGQTGCTQCPNDGVTVTSGSFYLTQCSDMSVVTEASREGTDEFDVTSIILIAVLIPIVILCLIVLILLYKKKKFARFGVHSKGQKPRKISSVAPLNTIPKKPIKNDLKRPSLVLEALPGSTMDTTKA